jgi:hypothetical protein
MIAISSTSVSSRSRTMDGHFVQLRALRGAPAAFAGDDLEALRTFGIDGARSGAG